MPPAGTGPTLATQVHKLGAPGPAPFELFHIKDIVFSRTAESVGELKRIWEVLSCVGDICSLSHYSCGVKLDEVGCLQEHSEEPRDFV